MATQTIRTAATFALVATGVVLAPPARAQSNAVAGQLFHEGQKLLADGKVHEACEKLSASYTLEAGLGTLMNLALCHERDGRTATAWNEFTEAAAQAAHASDDERAQFARSHAARLEQGLKKAVLHLATSMPGMTVKLDGRVLPSAALDTAIPVDPGSHAIEASAPSRKTYAGSFATGTDALVTVNLPELEPATVGVLALPPPTPETTAAPTPSAPPDTTTSPPTSTHSAWRTVGWISGGVGVASLAVAGVFGLDAMSLSSTAVNEKNKADSTPGDDADVTKANNDHSSALTSQNVAFAFGGVGAVCVGVGLYLVFANGSGPASPSTGRVVVTPDVALGRAGLSLGGAW